MLRDVRIRSRAAFVSCAVGSLLVLTAFSATAQESGLLDEGLELERRIRAGAGTEEELAILWQLATYYSSRDDTIRAVYAFERMRALPDWPECTFRRQALSQWTRLEEGRSRFARSAELRGEIVQLDIEEGKDGQSAQHLTNILFWADALVRAGSPRKAADVLLERLKTDLQGSGRLLIGRLLKTYSSVEFRPGELEDLLKMTEGDKSSQYIRHALFELCVERGFFEPAGLLLDELMQGSIVNLAARIDSILQMPDRDARIEEIYELIRLRSKQDTNALLVHLRLLEALGEIEDAANLARGIVDDYAIEPPRPARILPANVAEETFQALDRVEDAECVGRLITRMFLQSPQSTIWLRRHTRRLVATSATDEAVALWEAYAGANPALIHRWTEAGRAMEEFGLQEKALDFYKRGHLTTPTYETTLALADAQLTGGEFVTALSLYDQILKQRWVTGDWLASHVAERLDTPELGRDYVLKLAERMRKQPIADWQLLLAVDLATGDSEWKTLRDGILADMSGRHLVLCAGRLLVLDRFDRVDASFAELGTAQSWAPEVKQELAWLIAESGLERKPDGRRVVENLQAFIPYSATQPLQVAHIPAPTRRIAKLWLRGLVAAGELDRALAVVSSVSVDDVAAMIPVWGLPEARDFVVCTADIQARTANLEAAKVTIEAWREWDNAPSLEYLDALIVLWQGEPHDCLNRLETFIAERPGAVEANDAVELFHLLGELKPSSATHLSQGMFLEAQGRYLDADKPFRDLAIAERGTPVGDWARVRLARLAWLKGDVRDATGEWERLIPDAKLKTTAQRARWWLGQRGLGDDPDVRRRFLENTVLDGEEGLIVDLARSRLERMP